MTEEKTTAEIWAVIAMAHAEAAEIEFKKAERLYRADPCELRQKLVQCAHIATALAYVIASQANENCLAGHYKEAIMVGHKAYSFLAEVQDLTRLAETGHEDGF